ncbi:50S ribosomal protein L23 [Candidatus Falkowbacteria bacterium]|nr:50S ribosomal protein L23 [Candidatus Falkowbacteria bacterium]NCT54858.1 50S ribosomal protein L23 [Candidatus Falkowbacteria bacterium]
MKDLYAEQEDKKSGGTKVNNKRRPGGKSLSARTLVKPLVTEKAANLSDNGKYAFIVNVNANKIEVAKAVSDVYGVKVEAVNIIKMKGKAVSRGRIKGSRNDFKKAIVTLKKGETIQIYEGV